MVAVTNSSVLLQTIMYMVNQSMIQQDTSYNYYYLQIGKEINASRCYGVYGCFELSAPWTSEHRPVSLFPEELAKIEPSYLLYTRSNPTEPYFFDLNDYELVRNSKIKAKNPIYIVTHGYMEGGGIYWIKNTTERFLLMHDCSVIVIDWHSGSSPPYTQAVANIRLVGAMTAHLVAEITAFTGNLKADHVHCIGHSLGAHLCGYVGYTLQKDFNITLGRITGMDPAEPHFAKAQPPVRLDRSAAQYVDIIHTDASQFIRGGLGITESIGHVDYYPNGGNNQPGCTKNFVQFVKDEKGSFVRGIKKYLGCNHMISHEFFVESINGKCNFLTISCPSFTSFLQGDCFDCGKYGEKCLRFGFHGRQHYEKLFKGHKQAKESRIQYLLTSELRPYCRAHYRIHVQVSDSQESIEHGGEIGQLIFTMHSSTDGKGSKTDPVGFISTYHEPGKYYKRVVASSEIKQLKAVEIEWKYNSSLFNPLTWRLLTTPQIFLKKITVESLELGQSLTVCPKDQKSLINGQPQLMIPAYC